MTKSQSREIDFLEGPLIKNILMFTLPVLATGVLQFLYNASDSAVVGWLIGSNALGAVSYIGVDQSDHAVVYRIVGRRFGGGLAFGRLTPV